MREEDGNRKARMPEQWPPAENELVSILLDIFGQHLVASRDEVVRRAYATVVEGQPYARGRIHQRPFTDLAAYSLDGSLRDKLIDVVAVFVDEAFEHSLRLFDSLTNAVGEQYGVQYEAFARVYRRTEKPSVDVTDQIGAIRPLDGFADDADMISDEAGVPAPDHGMAEFPLVPISEGTALWFEYRRWLRRYSSFRPSARPSRSAP